MDHEKKFGKLTGQQVRELYATHVGAENDKSDFIDQAQANPETLRTYIEKGGSWGDLYSLPFVHVLAVFIKFLKIGGVIHQVSKQPDPQAAILDFLRSEPEVPFNPESLTDDDKGLYLSLLMPLVGNLESFQIHGISMHALVERAANGDDEALFMAVLVDRAVVQAEPIAQRICHAQMLGDESFMNQLAKAITRTKPRRPSQEYDDLRLILQLLDEASGLDTSTDEELYQLLVEDLELYPDDRKDPLAGLKKLIQKRKRVHGK